MNLGNAGTLALAIIAFLGLIGAAVAWFYRRGADEREMTIALHQNTKANVDLSAEVRDLSTEVRAFRAEVVKDLHSLDVRVTKLEAHDPAPANRNSSPARGH